MKPIIEALLTLAEDYIDVFNTTINENTLILDYMRDNRVYNTLEINEVQGNLVVSFKNEKMSRTVDIEGLKEILDIYKMQNSSTVLTQEEIKKIKNTYKMGSKIYLIKMYDLFSPPAKTIGTVTGVDNIGQIQMQWENGGTLALNIGVDQFKVLTVPRTEEEIQQIKDKYKIGTKVKMNKLANRPISKPGLLGNIEKIDEFGNIVVRYKTLGTETLVEGVDDFELL